jgi:F0F1-type ATP synthase alpha subunit
MYILPSCHLRRIRWWQQIASRKRYGPYGDRQTTRQLLLLICRTDGTVRSRELYCVYVAIGQEHSTVARPVETHENNCDMVPIGRGQHELIIGDCRQP